MRKKLILTLLILLILLLGFLSYNIFLKKTEVFASNDLCNSKCLSEAYNQGICNNGLKLPAGTETKGIGKCVLQECPGSDSCYCTCTR